ncbi:MAG: hypothetical protein ACI4RP_06570 [Acutalibacteraceae bacterium]
MIIIKKYVKINQIIENRDKSVFTLYLRVESEEWRVKMGGFAALKNKEEIIENKE